MSYTEVTVIVEGAVMKEASFTDSEKLESFIDTLRFDMGRRPDDVEMEVFLLDHDHDELGEDEECACAQYLQDHRPNYIFRGG